MTDTKERDHGGNRGLKDNMARAALLSVDSLPDTSDKGNPQFLACLDSIEAALLVESATLAPPAAPSRSTSGASILAAHVGHLIDHNPIRRVTRPQIDPADELAQLRAENARLQRENGIMFRTLGHIANDFQRSSNDGHNAAVMVVLAEARISEAKRAIAGHDNPRVINGGISGYMRVTQIGLCRSAVEGAIKKLDSVGILDYGRGEKVTRTINGREAKRTEGAYVALPTLPARIPELSQTDAQKRQAVAKNEEREKARRDAMVVEALEAVTCPHCNETGLQALCSHCGVIVEALDYQPLIDGQAAPAPAPAVTVERIAAKLPAPVPDSGTSPERVQSDSRTAPDCDTVPESRTLNTYTVPESRTTPDNGTATDTPSRGGPVITLEDILLVAQSGEPRFARQLLDKTPFNEATRKRAYTQLADIAEAPAPSNEQREAGAIALAERGYFDLARTVAAPLPSARRRELLETYISIGREKAA